VNPLNYDLIDIKNETAIARSIRNLVFTLPGERFFNQNLGSNISQSLFENIDNVSASILEDEIKNTIENYEPRVDLISVDVTPNYDNYEFNVTVKYYIVGIDVLPQQLTFALQSVR
jgi:phage baseplate assembly protein W